MRDAWARMSARLAPGGLLVEGTCDELGRIVHVGRDRAGCRAPDAHDLAAARGAASIRRSRRSGCRRRSSTGTCPASACTRSSRRSTTSGSAPPGCRRSGRCSAGRRALDGAADAPAGRCRSDPAGGSASSPCRGAPSRPLLTARRSAQIRGTQARASALRHARRRQQVDRERPHRGDEVLVAQRRVRAAAAPGRGARATARSALARDRLERDVGRATARRAARARARSASTSAATGRATPSSQR